MRVATGMAGLALIAGATMVSAQPAPSGTAADGAMAACGTIENRRSRLDCYDAMARSTSQGMPGAAPPSGATGPAVEPTFNTGRGRSAASSGARAPVAAGDAFGLDTIRQPAVRRATRRGRTEAHVTSATDDGIGHWTITLDSGAVWQMTEAVPGFRPPTASSEVRMRRNRFGSYFMDFDGQAGVRVARLR